MDSRRDMDPLKDMLPLLRELISTKSFDVIFKLSSPSVGGPTASVGIGLAADVGVLVLVTEVESEVVDDVACVLDHVGALLEVARSSITAQILEASQVVGVGSRRETREDALLRQEERTGADRQDGTLAGGVLLLQLGEVADESEGLVLLLKDLSAVASKDDENVKLFEAFVGLLVRDLGADDDALLREHLGLGTGGGDLESLGSWNKEGQSQY